MFKVSYTKSSSYVLNNGSNQDEDERGVHWHLEKCDSVF